jgi:ribosome-binding ATPase YchF (GTP1/OBG family)
VLYAANVSDAELHGDEGPHLKALREAIRTSGEHAEVVPFSAKIEAELAELPPEDRQEFLSSLGLESAGLDRLIHAGYHLLGLQTYFTAGEQEVRAWTIHRGDTAPRAAAVIHTDFERGFIRAETVSYDDFVALAGWKGAREKGSVRSEGKEYVVADGDVLLFRFNV